MRTINLMGHMPTWLKKTILAFLVINPIVFGINQQVGVWLLLAEFIFCLSQTTKAYPFITGGILAVEAIVIKMVDTHTVYHELHSNVNVLLLVLFMVAAVHFLADFLSFVFTKTLLHVKNKVLLSVLFFIFGSFMSAFSDALTVMASVLTMIGAMYMVYHKVQSGKNYDDDHHDDDTVIQSELHNDLTQFRNFLINLLMYAAIGTVAGGIATKIGEPQNVPLAEAAGWDFVTFVSQMKWVTICVNVAGVATVILLEKVGWFGYSVKMPSSARHILTEYDTYMTKRRTSQETVSIFAQGISFLLLIVGLRYHIAEPPIIATGIIILNAIISGKTKEHDVARSFHDALGFVALLMTFFIVVGAIAQQGIFNPIIAWVLTQPQNLQPAYLFGTSGILSVVSDNVFVALTHIPAIKEAYEAGQISKEHFELLIKSVNAGTNIPSIGTPNGQAAFIFIIMSPLAASLRLDYVKMMKLAFPFLVTLTSAALFAILYFK